MSNEHEYGIQQARGEPLLTRGAEEAAVALGALGGAAGEEPGLTAAPATTKAAEAESLQESVHAHPSPAPASGPATPVKAQPVHKDLAGVVGQDMLERLQKKEQVRLSAVSCRVLSTIL